MVGLLLRLLELNRIFDEKCRLLFSILQSSESLETSGIINRAIFSPPLYKSESNYYRFQKSIYLNDGSGKRCKKPFEVFRDFGRDARREHRSIGGKFEKTRNFGRLEWRASPVRMRQNVYLLKL